MYTWSIKAVAFDYDKFITTTIKDKTVDAENAQSIRDFVRRCTMRFNMRQLIEKTLDIVERDPRHQIAISSIVEIMAGCQYAHNDPSVGRLRQIKKHFSCQRNRAAIEMLRKFCMQQLSSKAYNYKDTWFKLRICCMDSYTLCHILSCTYPLCMYYAGMSHTRNIAQYLLQESLATKFESVTDPLHVMLKNISERFGLLHFEVLSLDVCNGPHALILLGEDHSKTDVEFSDHLLNLLRHRCSTDSNTLFLVEKHITNNNDPLQSRLACSQQNLAIHKHRCDSFVEREHESCPSLTIIPVDNRHTDMGFLRLEIMELWNCDNDFQRIASEFQDAALRSMLGFCDTLLACNQLQSGQ